MEGFYRLLLSALSVPWRSYIMANDEQLFSFLLSKDQECYYANTFYSYLFVSYLLHYTGTALIRYWYVKASLRPVLAEGFKTRWTLYVCLGAPQILLFIHIILFKYYRYYLNEELPFLFYQACKTPYSDYSLPLNKVMPLQQCMLYSYFAVMAYSNICLYRFLR